MAGFGDDFETALLQLFFNGTTIANLAEDAGVSPTTQLWVALHTADPGDSGDQGTNETTYNSYTRIGVDRVSTGWAVSSNSVSPNAAVTFPQATSTTTGTLTHASIGMTSDTSTGLYICAGTLSPNINWGENVTPSLTTSSSFSID